MKRRTDDSIILQMLEDGKQQKDIAEYFGVSPAAICKRIKRLHPPESKSLKMLSAKEQKFAIAISEGKTQTAAVMESFDVTTRDSGKSLGSKLMQRSDIQTAVSEIMQQEGLTRKYRVQKLKTHIDSPDPNVSLSGLNQSWKLDNAYSQTVYVPTINIEALVENRLTLEEASRQALERKNAALKQIAMLEAKASRGKP
jgi:predicted transcriptional regulator